MNAMVYSACVKNVCLSSIYRSPFGCRAGTIEMSPHAFYGKFGDPHALHSPDILNHSKARAYYDRKVTVEWCFDTPRGPVIVRDYWWNGPDELSLEANNNRAARWAVYYLRTLGIVAHRGMRPSAH